MTAQTASFVAMTKRMQEESSFPVGQSAIPDLHALAERMYLVEDQPAWSAKLCSRTAAAQAPKRDLADPSLAAALLGAGTDRLLLEPETLGFLFESQVVHDVRVYAQASGARDVFHYRDSNGRDEIDVIIEAEGGAWLAAEVKLGLDAVDRAAENLRRVAGKFVHAPVALAVIVPTRVAHERTDGVFVLPLTTLGP